MQHLPWGEISNFGAGGESRLMVDITRKYSDKDVIWQESVYACAREIAEANDIARIVDIGSGAGTKLLNEFSSDRYSLMQVDFADRRESRDGREQPVFFRANFESPHDLHSLVDLLDDDVTTLYILSDVVEHLLDPRWLLRALRQMLKRSPRSRLVISTPDRARIDGFNSIAVPDNPTHVRQWTSSEFSDALRGWGFQVEWMRHAKENKFDHFDRTLIASVKCDPIEYVAWLEEEMLPPAAPHLVITTEHSWANRTGGIGSFYEIAENADPVGRIVLFCGGHGLPQDWLAFCESRHWLHASGFGRRAEECLEAISVLDREEILEAVRALLFVYDDVRLMEYQDYLGIGVHVAQAARAGLLPPEVSVVAYAHGSGFYLDNAAGDISSSRDPELDLHERLSLELADCVLFPSEFLKKLYLQDWGISLRNYRMQPYPVAIPELPLVDTAYGKIDTLVFYGKSTSQKGYFEFDAAAERFLTDSTYASVARQVKKVFLLGVDKLPEWSVRVPAVEFRLGQYSRHEVLAILEQAAPTALIVLPYKGDNQPLSVFEVIGANAQLLAFEAGGIPEIVPEAFHAQVLCKPTAEALTKAIRDALMLDFWSRCELIKNLRFEIGRRWWAHSRAYIALMNEFRSGQRARKITAVAQRAPSVAVIVPNHNGSERFIRDVISGLRNSFLQPSQVLFVDDCSSERHLENLKREISEATDLHVELVRNTENIGLAGTRNRGLALVSAEYVCAHDNDNIVLNNFLSDACTVLDENPEVDAVTCWMRGFGDGDDWTSEDTIKLKYKWKPVGPDLGVGLSRNCFGDALAVYRTKTLKDIGGWDESSKGLWEDWQLFLRLTAAGKKVWVLPKYNFLYRIRQSSMARTYPRFPGWLRLSRALEPLPPNQRYGLIRAIASNHQLFMQLARAEDEVRALTGTCNVANAGAGLIHERLGSLISENQRLRAIEASVTWRATGSLRGFLTRHPKVTVCAKGCARFVYGLFKTVAKAGRGS